MKITIVNFSSRRDGNCLSIANLIQNQYSNDRVVLYNFKDLKIQGCGKCNYECLKEVNCCPVYDDINKIYESILNADKAIFIIPNYCDYPCSNFFVFNERSCGFFKQSDELMKEYAQKEKKFIVISNSKTKSFIDILKYQLFDQEPDILFLSAKKFNKKSLDGTLMEDEQAQNLVNNFISDIYQIEESAMAIVFYEDKILATKEDIYGTIILSLPKGHVEETETHIETAIRECFEETNIVLLPTEIIKELNPYFYKFMDHTNSLVKKVIYPIVFKIQEKGFPFSKEEQIKEVSFLNRDLFLAQCSYENVKEIVKIAMKAVE